MGDMKTVVVIPFRDRGIDPLRQANLIRVCEQYNLHGLCTHVVSDGRQGDEQFNRSAAYNRAISTIDADVYILAESDMIIGRQQLNTAALMSLVEPGMVVPFKSYHYLNQGDSAQVRAYRHHPSAYRPMWSMDYGTSIGAINVVSRETVEMLGRFDERFEGNWYDDDAMKVAFEVMSAPTRWVDGPAWHLYHLPGQRGDHVTERDRAATLANKTRYRRYRAAQTVLHGEPRQDRIRALLEGGD